MTLKGILNILTSDEDKMDFFFYWFSHLFSFGHLSTCFLNQGEMSNTCGPLWLDKHQFKP